MRATGIVRRLDDLGRVVIPKEIRRSMRLKEGEPLEIFTENNMVCFRKYDPIDVEKWETAKNVLRHLLIGDFVLENGDHEEKAIFGERYTVYENRTPITDDNFAIGYIATPLGEYTKEELAAAVKIAKEILLG